MCITLVKFTVIISDKTIKVGRTVRCLHQSSFKATSQHFNGLDFSRLTAISMQATTLVCFYSSKYIYRAPLITSESEALGFAARGIKSTMMQFSCSKNDFLGFGPNLIQSNPMHEWIQTMRNSVSSSCSYSSCKQNNRRISAAGCCRCEYL